MDVRVKGGSNKGHRDINESHSESLNERMIHSRFLVPEDDWPLSKERRDLSHREQGGKE